jgi:hypothetical protein
MLKCPLNAGELAASTALEVCRWILLCRYTPAATCIVFSSTHDDINVTSKWSWALIGIFLRYLPTQHTVNMMDSTKDSITYGLHDFRRIKPLPCQLCRDKGSLAQNIYWHFSLSVVAHFGDWLSLHDTCQEQTLFTVSQNSVHHYSSAHHISDLPRDTLWCAKTHYSAHSAMLWEATCPAHLGAHSTCSELAVYFWICQCACLDHELAIFFDFYALCMRSILKQLFRQTGHALCSTSDHSTTHGSTATLWVPTYTNGSTGYSEVPATVY